MNKILNVVPESIKSACNATLEWWYKPSTPTELVCFYTVLPVHDIRRARRLESFEELPAARGVLFPTRDGAPRLHIPAAPIESGLIVFSSECSLTRPVYTIDGFTSANIRDTPSLQTMSLFDATNKRAVSELVKQLQQAQRTSTHPLFYALKRLTNDSAGVVASAISSGIGRFVVEHPGAIMGTSAAVMLSIAAPTLAFAFVRGAANGVSEYRTLTARSLVEKACLDALTVWSRFLSGIHGSKQTRVNLRALGSEERFTKAPRDQMHRVVLATLTSCIADIIDLESDFGIPFKVWTAEQRCAGSPAQFTYTSGTVTRTRRVTSGESASSAARTSQEAVELVSINRSKSKAA